MKIETQITKMLNIDIPVIGAPMFLVSYPELVAAVSNAGGIGTFPSLNYRSISELRDGLSEIKEKTSRPIGVNIILMKRHNPEWQDQLKASLDFGAELIIISLGVPRTIIEEVKSTGAKIFCDVTTLRHARIVAKGGADGLIAVSQGAGGHAGAVSPFSLIPYLKEETGLPVIAAGSINDGKQLAASLSLGAGAVYVGTRLIASHESKAKQEYKDMLIRSVPEKIHYTDKVSGIPANWIEESLSQANFDDESEWDKDLTNEPKRWRDIFSAGHGVSQIKTIMPAKDIVTQMVQEYSQIVQNLPVSQS